MGESVLLDDCELGWSAPEGRMGEDVHLILDLGCTTRADAVLMRNLGVDRGTSGFSIQLSQLENGPWVKLMSGNLEKSKVCYYLNFSNLYCQLRKLFNIYCILLSLSS